ncbi:MAG: hypothetical protein ACPH4K_07970, partial [Flavobacteriaceae bacterium]
MGAGKSKSKTTAEAVPESVTVGVDPAAKLVDTVPTDTLLGVVIHSVAIPEPLLESSCPGVPGELFPSLIAPVIR